MVGKRFNRGKGNFPRVGNLLIGFNPTHVGKRLVSRCYTWIISVQPHACGEKMINFFWNPESFGSTPRMWGKAQNILYHFGIRRFNPTHVGKRPCADSLPNLLRFNPTHVGKSQSETGGLFQVAVQPHACGEKDYLFNKWLYISVQPHACGEKAKNLYRNFKKYICL